MASKHEQSIINHLRSNPGSHYTMSELKGILNIPYNHYQFLKKQVKNGVIEVVNPNYTPKSYRFISPVVDTTETSETSETSSENNTTTTTVTITITTTSA